VNGGVQGTFEESSREAKETRTMNLAIKIMTGGIVFFDDFYRQSDMSV
jgi:hypothetical protein